MPSQDGTWLIPALCLGQGMVSAETQWAVHSEVWFEDIKRTPRPQPNLSILDERVPFLSSRSPYTQTETLSEVTLKVILHS